LFFMTPEPKTGRSGSSDPLQASVA
jgi:hypothetical protein